MNLFSRGKRASRTLVGYGVLVFSSTVRGRGLENEDLKLRNVEK
jgi:hypothetical protein